PRRDEAKDAALALAFFHEVEATHGAGRVCNAKRRGYSTGDGRAASENELRQISNIIFRRLPEGIPCPAYRQLSYGSGSCCDSADGASVCLMVSAREGMPRPQLSWVFESLHTVRAELKLEDITIDLDIIWQPVRLPRCSPDDPRCGPLALQGHCLEEAEYNWE